MKFNRIAFAAAAICGSAASLPALAITFDQYTNTSEFVGDTLNIRISGASAQDNGVLGSALSLCVTGTVHRYAISNNAVFFCTPDIGTGPGQIQVPPGKTKLAIYKYSVGGSGNGVAPVNSNNTAVNQLPFLDLTKMGACAGTVTTPSFGTLGSYTNVACTAAASALQTNATTYIGLSDVEPAFFANAANTSNLTVSQATALIFGVPVSLNLRNALQQQQGLAVNSDLPSQMPSLSSAQLVSAYTQAGQTWAGIGVTTGFADDTIYVARRVDSSGTQKTFEALVARSANSVGGLKSCSVGTDGFNAPDSGAVGSGVGDNSAVCSSATPPTVYSGSGGGDVRACLINHNGANRGAIGILTTEDKPGTANWRWVAVDGFAPTQANVASGKYRFYTETAVNTRTAGAFATSAALGYTAVVNRLVADFGNPTIISAINGTADASLGNAGLMALLTRQTTSPNNIPNYTGSNSVVPWTKLVGGSVLNNCQAPKAVF